MEEVSKRFGEVVPGLKAAAGAVGLEDHREMLRDHRARVRNDYKFQQSLLGDTVSDDDKPEDDAMGDIIITGDLTFTGSSGVEQATKLFKGKVVDTAQASPPQTTQTDTAQKPPESPQTSAPDPKPETPSVVKTAADAIVAKAQGVSPWWKTAAIVGGSLLAGSGLGGATAAVVLNQAAPAVVAPADDTDTNSRLEFHDDPPPPSSVPAARRLPRPDRSV